ncbi:hypothetical protein lerEdw1_019524 [Lerista edwardsae]|nr:hypothetical protein lerEdw1_019524 [Lerista edwardsae]
MWQACGALLGHLWQLMWIHIWLATLGHVWHLYSSYILLIVLFPARGFVKMARHLCKPKEANAVLKELEEANPSLRCQQERHLGSPLLQRRHEPKQDSPVLHYLQHPEHFTAFHQQLLQPTKEIEPSVQQSEEISPVIQYLQRLQESGSNFQGDSSLMSSCPRNASQVESVIQVPMDMTFSIPASTYFETRMAHGPPEVPEHTYIDHANYNVSGAQAKRSPYGTPCKNARSQTENRATDFPSVLPKQPGQARSNSRSALRARTPSALCIHSGTPKVSESRNDSQESPMSKGTGNGQKGRPGSSRQSAKSSLEEMEDGYTNADEVMSRQYRPLGPRLTGSPRKTMKGSYEDMTRAQDVSSAKESLVSSGQDVKAEGKLIQDKKSSLIPSNIKAKYGTAAVEKLVSEEQARRTLCEAGLIQGQKRLSDRFKTLENPMASSPYADYYELGYNLRSNIFQGGPLESKSLMKDSYTPDVVKRAFRDPKHWHGRKTDDLGRWFQKNALNLNLQKALDEKYGERKGGKS